MSDFKTANTVDLTTENTLYDETGMSATITQIKEGLAFFSGLLRSREGRFDTQ